MAESVGLALLVVLDTLAPAERLAFVLHDMSAVPFDEIASILGRSPNATKQLASRARQRVQAAVASQFAERAVETLPALVAETPGTVWAITGGTPRAAFRFTIRHEKIAHVDLVFDPIQLRQLDHAIPDR